MSRKSSRSTSVSSISSYHSNADEHENPQPYLSLAFHHSVRIHGENSLAYSKFEKHGELQELLATFWFQQLQQTLMAANSLDSGEHIHLRKKKLYVSFLRQINI